jgi:hypothetical protein
MARRAVLYLGDGDKKSQLQMMHAHCRERGYTVAGVVTGDTPMRDVHAMVMADEADVFVIASRSCLPVALEIVTQEIHGRPPTDAARRPNRLK